MICAQHIMGKDATYSGKSANPFLSSTHFSTKRITSTQQLQKHSKSVKSTVLHMDNYV